MEKENERIKRIPDVERLALSNTKKFPGFVVWAKMPGAVWWPAIIEEEENNSRIYKIRFIDECFMEGWAHASQLLVFTGKETCIDGNTVSDGVDWSDQLKEALRLVSKFKIRKSYLYLDEHLKKRLPPYEVPNIHKLIAKLLKKENKNKRVTRTVPLRPVRPK